jgi:hypothetical protein
MGDLEDLIEIGDLEDLIEMGDLEDLVFIIVLQFYYGESPCV